MGFFADVASSAVAKAIDVVAYGLAWLIGQFIGIAAEFTGYTIKLNGQILSSEFVKTGWTITRDIANLGFVLVAIIIAIATIVRYKDYTAKALLPRLIAAAIFVNFSLVVAGFLLNFSDVLTNFFLSHVQNGDINGISSALAGAFLPQTLFQTPNIEAAGGDLAMIFQSFINLGATISFLVIALVSIAAMGIMFIVRYVHLAILLILSPILCLFFVIPGLSGQFSKRFGEFIQWAFFGPAVSFFIYLSLVMAEQLSKNKPAIGSMASSMGAGIVSNGLNMVVLGAIMLGGLMAAQNMGITGAAGAVKMISGLGAGAKSGIRKWAGNKTQGISQTAARGATRLGLTKTLNNLGKAQALQPIKTKSLLTRGGWTGENLKKKVVNVIGGIGGATTVVSAVRSGAASLGKTLDKTSKGKTIESQSLISSVSKGIREDSGLFKKKEKEKEEKTEQELIKELDDLTKQISEFKELKIDTKELESKQKETQGKLFKKQRENLEGEWAVKDIDELNKQIKKSFDNTTEFDINAVLSYTTENADKSVKDFLDGTKDKNGKEEKPAAGIVQLEKVSKDIDARIAEFGETPSSEQLVQIDKLKGIKDKLIQKTMEKRRGADTLLRIRDQKEKNEEQRKRALNEKEEEPKKEPSKIITEDIETKFKESTSDSKIIS